MGETTGPDERRLDDAYAHAFDLLLREAPIMTFVFDADQRLRRYGGGFPPGDRHPDALIGLMARDVAVPFAEPDEFVDLVAQALAGRPGRRTLDVSLLAYDALVEPLRADDGTVIGAIGFARDVTNERGVRRALERVEANLVRASRLASVAWWHFDIVTKQLTLSDLVLQMYGSERADQPDRETFTASIHPDDRARFRSSLIAAQRDGVPSRGADFRVMRPDGSYLWVLQQIEVVVSAAGEPIELHGTVVDITERKLLEEHLRLIAHVDGLTGLANRTLLGERLIETFADTEHIEPTALFYIDVDGFKTVNDTHGHGAGDALLKEVAHRIAGCLRAEDFVARSGGDEFVVVTTPAGDTNAVASLAERIVATCAQPYALGDRELYTSISIGISVAPADALDADTLLRNADSALYAAKLAGRNTHRFFTASMHAAAARQLELENDLRCAVERDQIFLAYQPIVAADGSVPALEALARWRHPVLGLVDPSIFIPVAEQSGSIRKLGTHLAAEALRALRLWRATYPDLRLALNISGYQLDHDGLLGMLEAALADARLDHTALDIEVTETVFMNDVARAAETLRELKRRGARVSIDDFGTGYSSLALLKHLPIDTIKIDRSFVSSVETDPEDLAIVGSIVSLATALSLDVIAEGVEHAGQVETLLGLGCRHFQGYAFSKPATADAIPDILRRFSNGERHPAFAS